MIQTQGLALPLGQTATVDIHLTSAAPTGAPWTVEVFDYDQDILGAAQAGLRLALDRSSGQSGDTLHLTITALTADATLGGEAFILVSDFGNPGDPGFESQLAMGLVTN